MKTSTGTTSWTGRAYAAAATVRPRPDVLDPASRSQCRRGRRPLSCGNGFRMRGNIGRDGAIAQRNQRLRALAHQFDFVQVFFAADRALDQRDIHVRREIPWRPPAGCRPDRLSRPRASSRSSISRNDIWQPEQPSSQTVARRSLLISLTDPPPHQRQVGQELAALQHFRDRLAFLKQRARRANVHALAASGTGFGRSPGLVQIGDHLASRCPGPSRPRYARPRSRRIRARSGCRECSGCDRRRSGRATHPPPLGIAVGKVHVGDFQLLRQPSATRSGRWRRTPSRRDCAR